MRTSNGNILFTYDALGNKWFKYVHDGNEQVGEEKYGTAYLFGFQYSFKYNEVVEYDWKLMHIATSEGYVSAVYPQGIGGNFKLHYVYNHTDHLGNIRQNITRKGNEIDILKEDNYYPFGLTHRGYNEQKEELKYDPEQDRIFTIQAQASRYRYQYNGKEWQEDVGVNWYDYGARNYDAAVGRWFNVDPLVEKRYNITTYNYVRNNPVNKIDLFGLLDGDYYDKNGKYLGTDGIDDNKIYVVKDKKEAKKVRKQFNKNKIIDPNKVNSKVELPPLKALEIAYSILNNAQKYQSFDKADHNEHLTLIDNEGKIYQGVTKGDHKSYINVVAGKKYLASIHLHPLIVDLSKNQWNAVLEQPDADDKASFKISKFNIIVGFIDNKITRKTNEDGTVSIIKFPKTGARFYNYEKYYLTLTEKALKNIINDQNKRR